MNGLANKRNTSNRMLLRFFASIFHGDGKYLDFVSHSPTMKMQDAIAESGTRTAFSSNLVCSAVFSSSPLSSSELVSERTMISSKRFNALS